MELSLNAKVMLPLYTLLARPAGEGTICTVTGLPEVTVPDAGASVNHGGPPNDAVPVNVTAVEERVLTVSDCGVALVNSKPEGCTILPVPAPGARTVRTTVTDCGELGALGD